MQVRLPTGPQTQSRFAQTCRGGGGGGRWSFLQDLVPRQGAAFQGGEGAHFLTPPRPHPCAKGFLLHSCWHKTGSLADSWGPARPSLPFSLGPVERAMVSAMCESVSGWKFRRTLVEMPNCIAPRWTLNCFNTIQPNGVDGSVLPENL